MPEPSQDPQLRALRRENQWAMTGVVVACATGGYLIARIASVDPPPFWPAIIGLVASVGISIRVSWLERHRPTSTWTSSAPADEPGPKVPPIERIEATARKYQATIQLGLLIAAVIALAR